ncbi:MAG TPA: hypothetical protein VKE96_10925 [Vicinamibacterales bacterium]|nr:hypothetical protein [Vicinamibacterales bacterium]
MTKRSRFLAAVAIVAGLAASGATVHGWGDSTRLTYLTFSGPVALPGVTLAAGTYAFQLYDPSNAGDVVLVRNRNRTQVFYLGFTRRVPRPASVRSAVSFGESAKGEPKPISVWYPPEMSDGLQFLYRP